MAVNLIALKEDWRKICYFCFGDRRPPNAGPCYCPLAEQILLKLQRKKCWAIWGWPNFISDQDIWVLWFNLLFYQERHLTTSQPQRPMQTLLFVVFSGVVRWPTKCILGLSYDFAAFVNEKCYLDFFPARMRRNWLPTGSIIKLFSTISTAVWC